MIIIVDSNGEPIPAALLQFGNGFHIDRDEALPGVIQIEVSGAVDVSKVVTREKLVSPVGIVTRELTQEDYVTVTVTHYVTFPFPVTVTTWLGTLSNHAVIGEEATRERTLPFSTVSKDEYERTVTNFTCTREVTRPGITVTEGTVTKEISVTKTITVTKDIAA